MSDVITVYANDDAPSQSMLMMMRRPKFLMMRRPEFLMMRRPCAALRRPENKGRTVPILLLRYDWKISKVTPIHKSEEKTLCSNYRQISVISIVPKVFEKVVHEQLMKYLEHHQIISKFQSGFRANHSTETSLLHVTNSWLANMDAGLINDVLFLDLKKRLLTR